MGHKKLKEYVGESRKLWAHAVTARMNFNDLYLGDFLLLFRHVFEQTISRDLDICFYHIHFCVTCFVHDSKKRLRVPCPPLSLLPPVCSWHTPNALDYFTIHGVS